MTLPLDPFGAGVLAQFGRRGRGGGFRRGGGGGFRRGGGRWRRGGFRRFRPARFRRRGFWPRRRFYPVYPAYPWFEEPDCIDALGMPIPCEYEDWYGDDDLAIGAVDLNGEDEEDARLYGDADETADMIGAFWHKKARRKKLKARRKKWRTKAAKKAGYKKRWHAFVPGQILVNPRKAYKFHKAMTKSRAGRKDWQRRGAWAKREIQPRAEAAWDWTKQAGQDVWSETGQKVFGGDPYATYGMAADAHFGLPAEVYYPGDALYGDDDCDDLGVAPGEWDWLGEDEDEDEDWLGDDDWYGDDEDEDWLGEDDEDDWLGDDIEAWLADGPDEFGRKYRQRRISKLKERRRIKKLKHKLKSGRWRGRKLSKERERKLRAKIKRKEKRVTGKIKRKEKREFKQKRRDAWRTQAAKKAGYKKRWHARVPVQFMLNPKKSLAYHKEMSRHRFNLFAKKRGWDKKYADYLEKKELAQEYAKKGIEAGKKAYEQGKKTYEQGQEGGQSAWQQGQQYTGLYSGREALQVQQHLGLI